MTVFMSEFIRLPALLLCIPNQNIENFIEKVIVSEDFLNYIMTNIQNKCSDIYLSFCFWKSQRYTPRWCKVNFRFLTNIPFFWYKTVT